MRWAHEEYIAICRGRQRDLLDVCDELAVIPGRYGREYFGRNASTFRGLDIRTTRSAEIED